MIMLLGKVVEDFAGHIQDNDEPVQCCTTSSSPQLPTPSPMLSGTMRSVADSPPFFTPSCAYIPSFLTAVSVRSRAVNVEFPRHSFNTQHEPGKRSLLQPRSACQCFNVSTFHSFIPFQNISYDQHCLRSSWRVEQRRFRASVSHVVFRMHSS
jgi:hypothetical protein